MYWGGLSDIIAYYGVVIILRLYLLEQCLNPVLRTSIKPCNFVTFYAFLIDVGMHHTCNQCLDGSLCYDYLQNPNLYMKHGGQDNEYDYLQNRYLHFAC